MCRPNTKLVVVGCLRPRCVVLRDDGISQRSSMNTCEFSSSSDSGGVVVFVLPRATLVLDIGSVVISTTITVVGAGVVDVIVVVDSVVVLASVVGVVSGCVDVTIVLVPVVVAIVGGLRNLTERQICLYGS